MPNPIERAAAKGMGKAKSVGARLEGLTGVFRRLSEQHGEVSMLLTRLKTTEEPEKREDLWNEIRIELLSHERAETSEVYPALRQHPETRQIADEHDREAGELEAAVDALEEVDFTSNEWDEKLRALIALVQHHVQEEEKEYFPKAQRVLGKDRAREIEQRFLAAKTAVVAEIR